MHFQMNKCISPKTDGFKMDANPSAYLQNNSIPFFFTAVVFSHSVTSRTPSNLHLVAIFSSSNYCVLPVTDCIQLILET